MYVNLGLVMCFWIQCKKAYYVTEKKIIWEVLKLKFSALWKTLLREWKDKAQTGRTLSKHTWKVLVPETYRDHLKLNYKQQNNPTEKQAKDPSRDFTREDT